MTKIVIDNLGGFSQEFMIIPAGYKITGGDGVAQVSPSAVKACLGPNKTSVVNPPVDPGPMLADQTLKVRVIVDGVALGDGAFKTIDAIADDLETQDLVFQSQELPNPPPEFYFSNPIVRVLEDVATSASEKLRTNFKANIIDFSFDGSTNRPIYKPSYHDFNPLDPIQIPGAECINFRGRKVPVFVSMINDSNMYFIKQYAMMNPDAKVQVKITDINDVELGGSEFYVRNANTVIGREGNPLPTFLIGTSVTYVQYIDHLPTDGKMFIETTVTDGVSPFAHIVAKAKTEYAYTVSTQDAGEGA